MGEQAAAGTKNKTEKQRKPERMRKPQGMRRMHERTAEGSADGDVAQLGEHLPCKQGVKGSNPSISMMGL